MFGSGEKKTITEGPAMNLEEFIAGSLSAIVNGVRSANATMHERTKGANVFIVGDTSTNTKVVTFDVAVTARSEGGIRGGVIVASLGVGAAQKAAHENVSRIKFNIEINGPMA